MLLPRMAPADQGAIDWAEAFSDLLAQADE